MSEDKRFEMMKTLKDRQDKFVYYITGLNVAALGFTLSKTYDLNEIGYHYIFFAVALLGWLFSTAMSFRWILIQFRTMEMNMDIFDLVKGFYDKSKISDLEKKKRVLDTYKVLQENAEKCDEAMRATLLLFITGIVFFIIWWVFDLLELPI